MEEETARLKREVTPPKPTPPAVTATGCRVRAGNRAQREGNKVRVRVHVRNSASASACVRARVRGCMISVCAPR